MPAKLKRIGGFLLLAWGVIRFIPDTLESVQATGRYAKWAYQHASIPHSWMLTVVILVVGVALVFSEDIEGFLVQLIKGKQAPVRTNIVLNHMALSKLGWDAAAGCYRRPQHLPPTGRDSALFANLIHISNESIPHERINSAGKIKAQLTYTLNGTKYAASPGTWADAPLNSVELGVGDTRYLILQLGSHLTEDWYPVVNRRNSPEEPVATSGAFDLWPNSEGEIDLQLLNEQGFLCAYRMKWKWDWNQIPQTYDLRRV